MSPHDDAVTSPGSGVGPDMDGAVPAGLPKEECEEVIEHIEGFLSSDRTAADESVLRRSVSESVGFLADLTVDELIRAMMKRSCCETAPEALRVRIRAQVEVWRLEG